MNILIISFDADPPYMGGVATMTNLLAKGFIAKGHSYRKVTNTQVISSILY